MVAAGDPAMALLGLEEWAKVKLGGESRSTMPGQVEKG